MITKSSKYTLCLWLILLLANACQQNSPVEQVPSQNFPGLPHQVPEAWLMAHIDVETTGLIPGYHEMIDIGVVYTDLQGQILDSLFLRIQPKHPLRMDSGAYRVNNFNPQLWEQLGAVSIDQAVDSLRFFHAQVAGQKPVLMVAYNSYFDAAFLDHLFRGLKHPGGNCTTILSWTFHPWPGHWGLKTSAAKSL